MNKATNKLIPELRFPEFANNREWEENQLDKLGDTISGLSGKSGEDFGVGKPYVTYKQVFDSAFIDFAKCGKVNIGENENQNTLQKGDILFTTSSETPNEVGFASVLLESPSEATYLNSFCFAFRPENLSHLKPEFSRFLFHSSIYRKSITVLAQGSTRYNISKGAFLNLKLPIPKPKEQQKIASCLSSLDEVITAHIHKLEALKAHKKGLMQNLFPQEGETVPKWRFKEFKDKWIKTKLNKHIDLLSGYAFQSIYFSGNGQKLLTPKNFTKDGVANFNSENTKNTTEKNDEKYLCREGDLLLLLTDLTSSCELLGKPILLKKEDGVVLLNQRIVRVMPMNRIKKEFLLQFFLTDYYHKRIKNTASGSTVRHSSNKIILETELFYPADFKEQQKIAECLSSLDTLITVHAENIELLKLHKKGLMQGLFPKINN